MKQSSGASRRPLSLVFGWMGLWACLGGPILAETSQGTSEVEALTALCRAGVDVSDMLYDPNPDLVLERYDRAVEACNTLVGDAGLDGADLAYALLDRADLIGGGDEGLAQARLDYEQAIALMPELSDAYWRRGKSNLLYARDLPKALIDLDQAIELDGSRPEYYVTRSSVLGFSGRPAESMADLETALRLDPQSVHALTNRGLAHFNNGDFTSAAKDFDAAILLTPDDPSLYSFRSALRLQAGDKEGSEEDAETARKLMYPAS